MGRLSDPRFRIAVLAAALALAAAGCGGDDDSAGGGGDSGPTTITVGTLPIANAAPMYLGMEKGFFEEENLTIEPQIGEGGAAVIAGITPTNANCASPDTRRVKLLEVPFPEMPAALEQKRVDAALRFARAMNRSLEYARDNPEEVRRIVPTYTETPEEAARQMRLPVFDPELDREGIELEAELTAKYGIIEEPPSYEELVRE